MFHLSPPLKALSQGNSDSQILDLSNRFYTLIPHDFGMKKPPLLSNADSVQVSTGAGRDPRVCWAVVLLGVLPPCDSLFTAWSPRAGVCSGTATSVSSFCSGVSTRMGGDQTAGRTDAFSCLAPLIGLGGRAVGVGEPLVFSSLVSLPASPGSP